jgi:hypothetical protein
MSPGETPRPRLRPGVLIVRIESLACPGRGDQLLTDHATGYNSNLAFRDPGGRRMKSMMTKVPGYIRRTALSASLALMLLPGIAQRALAAVPRSAGSCLTDLEAIPAFLLTNDAGARDELAQLGQKHFDDAMAEARESAASAATPDECVKAINPYLRAWRRGHLWVDLAPQAQAPGPKDYRPQTAPNSFGDPTYRELSPKTILLTLPTFEYPVRDKLEALLKEHRKGLVKHPDWIIDVRDNGGGTDASFQPLLPWLTPGGMVTVGMLWYSTPANVQDWREMCRTTAPGNKECEEIADSVIDRMKKVPAGSWAPAGDHGGISYWYADSVEQHRPGRVAVLIDHPCASSCEQFVLTVRQSFAVKLIGRHTFGSLDYSNLVPRTLPSGNLRLWYTTSRSLRIPDDPVDVAGISPDLYLPLGRGPTAKDDEIKRVQNWLEGGSLAPLKGARLSRAGETH